LQLRFGTADPIVITLPFPSTGYLAFDQNSDPLPRSITVEDLLGARLYLFGGPEITTTEYELALRLKREEPLNLHIFWKIKDQNSDPLPSSITVEDLLGARLYLFGGPEITTTEYELALRLKGEKPLNLSMFWKIKVQNTPKEIELFPLRDEIEQLLSLQRGID